MNNDNDDHQTNNGDTSLINLSFLFSLGAASPTIINIINYFNNLIIIIYELIK